MPKINSTALCLSLVLTSLEIDLAPEVTSQAGTAALYLIKTSITDLLKRQGPSIALLGSCIKDGEILRLELLRALGDLSAHEVSITQHETDFDGLAIQYETLVRNIDELCNRLSRSNNSRSPGLLREAAKWEEKYDAGIQTLVVQPYGEETLGKKTTEQAVIAATSKPALSKEFMQTFLNSRRGPLEVTSFSQMSGGYGKQTYQCEVSYTNGKSEGFIIRKADAVPIISFGMYLPDWEYDLLRDLSTTKFPCPRPSDLCYNNDGVDGTFYTMNRLRGSVSASFLDLATMKFSNTLILRLASLLAELHSVPLSTFSTYFKHEGHNAINLTIQERYRQKVERWRAYAKTVPHLPSPYLTWLLDWLYQHIPTDRRTPVLTHGDFNFHNLMVENDDITGVLDWECADFGAPEIDLAYVQPLVKRHMSWEAFLAHYYQYGGKQIDERLFSFVQAFGVVEKIMAFNRATLNHQNGSNKDIRFVMVGYGINATFMGMGLAYTQEAMFLEQNGVPDKEEKKDQEIAVLSGESTGKGDHISVLHLEDVEQTVL